MTSLRSASARPVSRTSRSRASRTLLSPGSWDSSSTSPMAAKRRASSSEILPRTVASRFRYSRAVRASNPGHGRARKGEEPLYVTIAQFVEPTEVRLVHSLDLAPLGDGRGDESFEPACQ